jgi:3-methyladenine DNA glycosylase AlkD
MQKRFTYLTSDVVLQLQAIKKAIYLKMNGVTVESMERSGVCYHKSFGVSLPEIKQLAIKITPNHSLAQSLWHEKIRETMLIASFIQPLESFNEELAADWLADVNNAELAEQLSRNLFGRLPFAPDKVVEWGRSDDKWLCAVGFFTAAFCCDRLTPDDKTNLLKEVLKCTLLNEPPVYRAVALFLRKLGATGREEANAVLAAIKDYGTSTVRAKKYIFEEVNTDLNYRFG